MLEVVLSESRAASPLKSSHGLDYFATSSPHTSCLSPPHTFDPPLGFDFITFSQHPWPIQKVCIEKPLSALGLPPSLRSRFTSLPSPPLSLELYPKDIVVILPRDQFQSSPPKLRCRVTLPPHFPCCFRSPLCPTTKCNEALTHSALSPSSDGRTRLSFMHQLRNAKLDTLLSWLSCRILPKFQLGADSTILSA